MSGRGNLASIDRRTLFKLAAGSGAAVGLSACSGTTGVPGSPASSLTYWNLFGGGDGQRMTQMERAYSKKSGSADLKSVTLSWGIPYYTKLAMAIAGGSPPDVAILHLSRMPQFGPSGMLRPFTAADLQTMGLQQNDIAPLLWKKATFGGKLLAVPLDTHPLVLYYNTDVCKKAGLLDGNGQLKPLTGKADVLAAFAAAKKVTGKWGVTFDTQQYTPWRLFWALLAQQGNAMFSADGSRYTLDEQKASEALDFIRGLTHGRQLAPPGRDYTASVALFQAGAAGFHLNGEWEVGTFQAAGLPFDMTLMPQVFAGRQTWADSHSFVIPKGARNVEAALGFIATMLRESLTWAKGGHIPAYTPVRTSSAYQQLTPQSHYAAEINHVAYDPPVWFSGAASPLEDHGNSIAAAVINDQLSAGPGLRELRSFMEDELVLPKPFTEAS